jgi:hypothetical protein
METLEARAGDESPLTPGAAERNQRIVDALRAANPGLPPGRVPSDENIAVTDQDGIEVSLLEHQVAINFPYCDSPAAFREAFGAGTDAVNRSTEEEPRGAEPRPPWWKRLFGSG